MGDRAKGIAEYGFFYYAVSSLKFNVFQTNSHLVPLRGSQEAEVKSKKAIS